MKYSAILFLLVIVLLFPPVHIKAQDKIWYFGDQAGIDFTGSMPVALTDGALGSEDYSATISDNNGNLLFYTNGMTVWDKNHNIMPNGTGLLGESSNGQCALIIQQPGTPIYFIFTVGQYTSSNGFRYHTVDITQNGGNGAVISKNNLLLTPSTERLDAVYDPNTNSYWIVTHEWNTNNFYSYKVDVSGLNTSPVISSVGTVHTGGALGNYNSMGQMCISPTKNKLICGIYSAGIFELFDFNIPTGVISNPVTLTGFPNAWGAAFSPNGSKLYVTRWLDTEVYQMDITSGVASTILATSTVVGNGTGPGAPYQVGYLQLAPDDKIYGAVYQDDYLVVINQPNLPGSSCGFIDNGFFLNGKKSSAGLCRSINPRTEISSVNTPDQTTGFVVYPNPFQDEVFVSGNPQARNTTQYEYKIYNSLGHLIQKGAVQNNIGVNLKLSFLAKGFYFLSITDDKGTFISQTKLIRQ